MAVERALISVFDKTGIVEFAKRLAALQIEILSTGGTSKLLREAGVPVRDVADFTGWPEMLGGRVKTLHPKVHGGLLYRRNHADDQKQAAEHGIAPIDLVVVNLYPFEATAAKQGLDGGRVDREHRHRRSHHAALCGKKFRKRHGRDRSRRLRTCSRKNWKPRAKLRLPPGSSLRAKCLPRRPATTG